MESSNEEDSHVSDSPSYTIVDEDENENDNENDNNQQEYQSQKIIFNNQDKQMLTENIYMEENQNLLLNSSNHQSQILNNNIELDQNSNIPVSLDKTISAKSTTLNSESNSQINLSIDNNNQNNYSEQMQAHNDNLLNQVSVLSEKVFYKFFNL